MDTVQTAHSLDQNVGRWRPYPAYKDSGVEWLGRIPAQWELIPLKYATELNVDTLPEGTPPDYLLQYLDISNVDSTGQILHTGQMTFDVAPTRARRRVKGGDTIVSTVRTYLKAIAFMDCSPDNLIVSTGFAVLRPKSTILPKFLWRLTQSNQFVDAIVCNSVGVGYPAITPNKLGSLSIWIPALSEQRTIAAFLDRETARIDAVITEQGRLVELLREKRAVLISQAVTRGLDPSVPMRDSGVEWIGQIPTHWQMCSYVV